MRAKEFKNIIRNILKWGRDKFWPWFKSNLLSKEFFSAILTSLVMIGIAYYGVTKAIPQFIEEKRFEMKRDVYVRSLEMANYHLLSMDMGFSSSTYHGVKCGKQKDSLFYREANNAFTMLALVSDNKDIPLKYLELLSATTSLIQKRDEYVELLRKDLDFKKPLWGKQINNGNTFITPEDCEIQIK